MDAGKPSIVLGGQTGVRGKTDFPALAPFLKTRMYP